MTDATAGILGLGMVLAALAIMASRTLAPVKAKPKGRIEASVRLPLFQRALSQKVNVISICLIVVLGGGALTSQRIISPLVGILALVVMLGLIAKPQNLVITNQGMLVHNAAFRAWKDFDAVSMNGGKLRLHSQTRLASTTVYLPASRRDEVLAVVQRHVGTPTSQPRRVKPQRRSKQPRTA